jgi:Na+-transporting methylmalonyl-CoA/oxaloacetate decarboxylase gamma subunit
MMLVGVAQTVLSMGIVFFLLMMPLPTINALFASILQAKVPPDLQGRVFATTSQMSMLMTPLAYLIVGPLVDGVLEPAVGEPGWETIGLLVGNETGAGMGLLFLFNGLLVLATSAMMYAWPMIRTMETDLPDYHTEVEEKETENKEINETPLGDEQVPVTV